MTINSMVPMPQKPRRGKILAVTACALLAAGISGIAVAQTPPAPPAPPAAGAAPQPQAVMLLTPVAIGKLQASDVVAVKGSVAEIYGNKFILQDDSGRMLVELGPRGDDANVVTKGEQVAVQGRFDRGFIAAQVLSHADGRNQAFGPPAPPPRPDRDADRGPGRRPPPPPR
jgi:uncharacterized protein YdeI (BOF family)